jgi:hypothetical protein
MACAGIATPITNTLVINTAIDRFMVSNPAGCLEPDLLEVISSFFAPRADCDGRGANAVNQSIFRDPEGIPQAKRRQIGQLLRVMVNAR